MNGRLHELLRSVDGFRLPLEETLSAVAVPPVHSRRLPRVEHFLAPFEGPVCKVVAHSLKLPEAFISELVRFGAVYSCPVIPETAPSLSLTQTEGMLLQQLREEAVECLGRHPSLRHPRRVDADDVLRAFAYCRVHVHPKRFPAFYAVDWASRVILENDHCVVVNKPARCQVPPRVDNRVECLTHWVGKTIGMDSELKPVHRLDTGTEGLLVLAKTTAFARFFQKLLNRQDGHSVVKKYRALTLERPPMGTLVHYVKTGNSIKGQPRRSFIQEAAAEGYARAELTIEETKKVQLSEEAERLWKCRTAYQSAIELQTGRTHQIRVQLAHMGCPLLGDGLYGIQPAVDVPPDDCIGLQAASLTLRDDDLGTYFDDIKDGYLLLTAGRPWWNADC